MIQKNAEHKFVTSSVVPILISHFKSKLGIYEKFCVRAIPETTKYGGGEALLPTTHIY